MLRLMLFRHAHASRPADVVDHERPLSAEGHEQAARMGAYLSKAGLIPDMAVVSTARRTQETWNDAVAAGGMSASALKVDESRIYESAAGDLLEVLRSQDARHRSVMLLGHNPGMERLAAWLIGEADRAALARLQREFVVGGLAVIDFQVEDWSQLDVQGGRLERFETPDTVA